MTARRSQAGAQEENLRLRKENQRLRRRLQRQQPREDLRYLFILTYGRSGSTLLLGILNRIPGYLLRGENGLALRHLQRYQDVLLHERGRHPRRKAREVTYPWFGITDVPPRRLVAGIRRLALDTLLRPGPDTVVTGFKEIRWTQHDLEGHVAWLQEVFPGARFVINTRRLEDVLGSRWWAEGDVAENERVLRDADRRLRRLAVDLGEDAYHVHYDDYVADPSLLRGLFAWLDAPWDESAVRQTLDITHSIPRVRRRPADS